MNYCTSAPTGASCAAQNRAASPIANRAPPIGNAARCALDPGGAGGWLGEGPALVVLGASAVEDALSARPKGTVDADEGSDDRVGAEADEEPAKGGSSRELEGLGLSSPPPPLTEAQFRSSASISVSVIPIQAPHALKVDEAYCQLRSEKAGRRKEDTHNAKVAETGGALRVAVACGALTYGSVQLSAHVTAVRCLTAGHRRPQ